MFITFQFLYSIPPMFVTGNFLQEFIRPALPMPIFKTLGIASTNLSNEKKGNISWLKVILINNT